MGQEAGQGQLVWHELNSVRADKGVLGLGWNVFRAKVPGGWLVLVMQNVSGVTFVSDPDHSWDGSSLA